MALLVKRPMQHNMAQPAVATVCVHRELYTASAVFLLVGSGLLKDQLHLSCCLPIAGCALHIHLYIAVSQHEKASNVLK